MLVLGALLCWVAAGCGGKSARLDKPAGSALWVEADGLSVLEPEEHQRLRDAGVGELFWAGGRLSWEGDRPVIDLGGSEGLPRRSPVTVVVSGRWPTGVLEGPLAEPEQFGRDLGAELERLRLAAEARGLLVIGIHLDLRGPEPAALEALAEALDETAGSFGEGRYLSLEVDRRWLGTEHLQELVDSVDFFTCRLYGQPLEQAEDEELWRHDRVLETMARLDQLGRGYLIGVTSVGGVRRLDAAGKLMESSSVGVELGYLVRGSAFERNHDAGFLQGLDRGDLTFTVRRTATAGPWRLAPGEQIRTVELREHDLYRMRDRLRFAELQNHLGELYIRAPREGEHQALKLIELAGAVSGVPTEADLRAELRDVRAVRGGLSFRVAVLNPGERDTDVAYLETNYLDVAVPGGVVASAQAGQFLRYERRIGGRQATDMRAFRNADSVRLFVPLLQSGEAVVSGPIVVRTRSGRVVVGGTFSLPGGELFDLPETGLP